MPASSGSGHSTTATTTAAATLHVPGSGDGNQAPGASGSSDSTTGVVTLGRPPSSESARVSHLRLLRRAATLREEAQHAADERNRSYSVLHLLAASPAAPVAQGSVIAPPTLLRKSSTFGGAPVHGLRASIPSSVWSGPSPLLTIEPHTLTPSKCTWTLQQLQQHAAMQQHDHAASTHQHRHGSPGHPVVHRPPKIQYVSVTACYEEERSQRAANCARSTELLKRARTMLDQVIPGRRPRPVTKATSESTPRPALSRTRTGTQSTVLSRTEAQSLLQGPIARQYGSGGGSHQPKSSLHMLLPDDQLTDLQRQAAADSDQLPQGNPLLGRGASASESLDPAEAARQKARARMAANFTSIEAQSRAASEAATRTETIADWTLRIEWYFFGLLASLYFTIFTPFSTAFFSSLPTRWVNLNIPPFNPRLDHDGNPEAGGPWHYPYFENSRGRELYWHSASVLPWIVCDFLLSLFFLLEIWINVRYHAGGYLYAKNFDKMSKEEEEQEQVAEADRQREQALRSGGGGLVGKVVIRLYGILAILRSKRWRNYMKHAIWMDLLACALPYELYSVCGGSLRWTFLLRLIRVWWVTRFGMYIALIRLKWKVRQRHTRKPQA